MSHSYLKFETFGTNKPVWCQFGDSFVPVRRRLDHHEYLLKEICIYYEYSTLTGLFTDANQRLLLYKRLEEATTVRVAPLRKHTLPRKEYFQGTAKNKLI